MLIKIAERFKPFSHLTETLLTLPGSSFRLKLFPTRFQIDDVSKAEPIRLLTVDFDLKGPLEQFTVQQDLEKGEVLVWGKAINGFVRYRIQSHFPFVSGTTITFEKTPLDGIRWQHNGLWGISGPNILRAKDSLVCSKERNSGEISFYQPNIQERLSLGICKSQDWELIRRRCDLREIFPLWHRLGLMIPSFEFVKTKNGTMRLIEECRQAISDSGPEFLLSYFKRLFLAGFESMLSPRLTDTSYQGIIETPDQLDSNTTSLQLLIDGGKLIRSLFIQERENKIYLLPALPPEFHCGRFAQLISKWGICDIEWTKKALRRVVFHATKAEKISFVFSKGEKRCRLRHSYKDKGTIYINGSTIDLQPDQNYWFDNFSR